mgnify:CR=1 FL=1|jgi:predicted ATPase
MKIANDTNMNTYQNLYVITGGPGCGKTSLLGALESDGFFVVPEDARQIIKDQMAIGGVALPWKDKAEYAQLMFLKSVETYRHIANRDQAAVYLFDRGILDSICYMNMEGIAMPDEFEEMAQQYRYNLTVFVLPPWKEIYETDNERKQSWAEAAYTFEKMIETYKQYGYQPIIVPKDTIENRRQFILSHIGA